MNKEEIKKELHKKSKEELIKYLLEDVNTIQYLEQKESILDKVTDKLKEDAEIFKKENVNGTLQNYVAKILKFIEGEKEYCCNCGVELNSKNKALNNMCNERKYGLDY